MDFFKFFMKIESTVACINLEAVFKISYFQPISKNSSLIWQVLKIITQKYFIVSEQYDH